MKPSASARPCVSPGSRFPTFRRLGVAVEHFPRYVNRKRRLHTVDLVLISLTVRGRAVHVMDDEEYIETPNSLGITHYGQAHDIVTDDEGIEIFNIYLDLRNHPLPALPSALSDVLAGILPLHPRLCHRLNRRVHLRLDEEQQAARLLERIVHEQDFQDPSSGKVIRSLLGIFLVELCRAALRHGLVAPSAASEKSGLWLERLRQDLDRRYAEPLTLGELARGMGIHPSYLCRAFKQYAGATLTEYLNLRRIQAAMIRIRGTHAKIIQIALECGFNDIAYFNRKFRAITGCTPTQYRAEVKHPVRRARQQTTGNPSSRSAIASIRSVPNA